MRAERDDDLTDLAAIIDGGGALSRRTWRLAAWAGATVLALALVVAAVVSETGSQRLTVLVGARPASAPKTASRTLDMELELRRMSEAVRSLTIDRDRLQSRLSMLERNLDEATVTGSIPPNPARALGPTVAPGGHGAGPAFASVPPPTGSPTPASSALGHADSAPGGLPPATARPEPKPPPAAEPLPSRPRAALQSQAADSAPGASAGRGASLPAATIAPSSDTAVIRTEFGIDVGGDQSVEGLRNMWAMLRGGHPALFENLRPVISIRDGPKPGALELRLIAGPLANASMAARYCAVLAASGLTCQPAVFDGQRLALR